MCWTPGSRAWLWPFSTLGWPDQTADLQRFYPTSVLSTAPEIIFFWVARMIMAGLEFMGEMPFTDVYLHGTVRDEKGRKMSKSLGNAIDPLELIGEYGADAMRFTLISITATGSDVYPTTDKFLMGRNFANKLWNASRFVLMNFPEDFSPQGRDLPELGMEDLPERWILSRLERAGHEAAAALDAFRLNDAAGVIYQFIWHDYCDWYIELSKEKLARGGAAADKARLVLWHVLESALRLLHPFMPFITEEIWQKLPHQGRSIFQRPWLGEGPSRREAEAEGTMELVQELVVAVRTIRSEMNVPPTRPAHLAVIPADPMVRAIIERSAWIIRSLARVEEIEFVDPDHKPRASGIAVIGRTELFVPLKGLIDLERERQRLGKEAERLRALVNGLESKLDNSGFVGKAPAEVVEKERQKLAGLRETLQRLEKNLVQLSE